MSVVLPNIEDSPSFDAMAVRDSVDYFAMTTGEHFTGVDTALASGALLVTQDTGSNMAVAVAAGTYYIDGVAYTYAGGSGITIQPASSTDRRDTIVATSSGVSVVMGNPAPTGSANWTKTTSTLPPVKTRAGSAGGPSTPGAIPASCVVLGEVYVAAATTVITTAANVVDKRTALPLMVAPAGQTGATSYSAYSGATASGAPVTGTWAVGQWVIDQSGQIWICVIAGTPGTWVSTSGTISSANALEIIQKYTTITPPENPLLGGTALLISQNQIIGNPPAISSITYGSYRSGQKWTITYASAHGIAQSITNSGNGHVSSGLSTLTDSTAAFTQADVGKNIVIQGVGAGGAGGADAVGVIATVVSATSITMSMTSPVTSNSTTATYTYGAGQLIALSGFTPTTWNTVPTSGIAPFNVQMITDTVPSPTTVTVYVPTGATFVGSSTPSTIVNMGQSSYQPTGWTGGPSIIGSIPRGTLTYEGVTEWDQSVQDIWGTNISIVLSNYNTNKPVTQTGWTLVGGGTNTGVATANSTTFTDASAPFTSGVVGETISIIGAGINGATLTTTIAGFTNSTTITLTVPAYNSVSPATYSFGSTTLTQQASTSPAAGIVPGLHVFGSNIIAGTYVVSVATVVSTGQGVVLLNQPPQATVSGAGQSLTFSQDLSDGIALESTGGALAFGPTSFPPNTGTFSAPGAGTMHGGLWDAPIYGVVGSGPFTGVEGYNFLGRAALNNHVSGNFWWNAILEGVVGNPGSMATGGGIMIGLPAVDNSVVLPLYPISQPVGIVNYSTSYRPAQAPWAVPAAASGGIVTGNFGSISSTFAGTTGTAFSALSSLALASTASFAASGIGTVTHGGVKYIFSWTGNNTGTNTLTGCVFTGLQSTTLTNGDTVVSGGIIFASTQWFPDSAGTLKIFSGAQYAYVAYTDTTSAYVTGTSAATSLTTLAGTLTVNSTARFPVAGTGTLITNDGPLTISWTGIGSATTLTGVTTGAQTVINGSQLFLASTTTGPAGLGAGGFVGCTTVQTGSGLFAVPLGSSLTLSTNMVIVGQPGGTFQTNALPTTGNLLCVGPGFVLPAPISGKMSLFSAQAATAALLTPTILGTPAGDGMDLLITVPRATGASTITFTSNGTSSGTGLALSAGTLATAIGGSLALNWDPASRTPGEWVQVASNLGGHG